MEATCYAEWKQQLAVNADGEYWVIQMAWSSNDALGDAEVVLNVLVFWVEDHFRMFNRINRVLINPGVQTSEIVVLNLLFRCRHGIIWRHWCGRQKKLLWG